MTGGWDIKRHLQSCYTIPLSSQWRRKYAIDRWGERGRGGWALWWRGSWRCLCWTNTASPCCQVMLGCGREGLWGEKKGGGGPGGRPAPNQWLWCLRMVKPQIQIGSELLWKRGIATETTAPIDFCRILPCLWPRLWLLVSTVIMLLVGVSITHV